MQTTTISSIRIRSDFSSSTATFHNSSVFNQRYTYTTAIPKFRYNNTNTNRSISKSSKEFNPIASTSKLNPSLEIPPSILRAREEAARRKDKIVFKAEGSKKDGIFTRSSIGEKKLKISYEVKDNRGAASWSISQKKGKGREVKEFEVEEVPSLYAQEPLRVPKTEKELLDSLVVLRTLGSKVSADKLFNIHSHYSLRHLVSRRTYTYLLTHTYKDSNLRLAREILDEMEERGIERDEMIRRILLTSNLVRGDAVGVESVLRGIEERNIVALPILNWRRDLGVEGKGQGDDFKVWHKKTERDSAHKAVEAMESMTNSKSGWKGNSPSIIPRNISILDKKLAKQPSRIPDDFERLSSHDIRALLEALVQDQRASEAFLIAQSWLDVNRPTLLSPSSPPSAFLSRLSPQLIKTSTQSSELPPPIIHHSPARFRPAPIFILPRLQPILTLEQSNFKRAQIFHNGIAITLLNILIKALLSTGSSPSSCKTFVSAFCERNSFPESILLPNQITLIELIRGYEKSAHSWSISMRMVNWFAVTFGFKVRLSSGRYGRRKFISGSSRQLRRVAPQHNISPDIGRLLLRYAIEDLKSSNVSEELKIRVRKWWREIERHDIGWSSEETVRVVKKAIEVGLLEHEKVRPLAKVGGRIES